jgi:YfiH family protein
VFAFRDSRGSAQVAFTDRHGGSSVGAYASLDLGTPRDAGGAGADPQRLQAARANIDLVVREFAGAGSGPPPLQVMDQVQGADVAIVEEAGLLAGGPPAEADALVTALPGVVLVVRIADCVPVLLADPAAGVVAAVHAGRPGLVAGVVPAALAAMTDLGATRIHAWVGPRVCGGCYEVPAAMREEVSTVVPEAWGETSWGTPSVDVGAGVLAQLRRAEVEVVDAARCTREDEDLYSYRRQGTASGRLGGLVWTRP